MKERCDYQNPDSEALLSWLEELGYRLARCKTSAKKKKTNKVANEWNEEH